MKPNSSKPANATNATYVERQPAVHLTRKGLQMVLEQMAKSSECPFTPAHIPWIREELLRVGRPYAVRGRLTVLVKQSGKRQATELQMNVALTEKFAHILRAARLHKGHKVLSIIGPSSAEWKTLTQVAKQAEQFSEALGMAFLDGAKRFVEIGLSMMKTYKLASFQYNAERILAYAVCERELENDPTPEYTRRLYDAYVAEIRKGGSIPIHFDKDPLKYAEFLRVKEWADRYNASYEDWIQAQFEGLLFVGEVPEVAQLWGEKAADRYSKAVYRWKT